MPTLSDVARRAGVSYATVDRVVNGRGGVAQKSAARVRDAIMALDYVRNVAAANLAQRRTYSFAAILPAGDTLSRHFAELSLAPEVEGRNRHEEVKARVAEALIADSHITAIYSAGAGNSGLLRVLEALPPRRRRPIVVLHELVAHSRRAPERGLIDVVIDQRSEEEVTIALSLLRGLAERRSPGARGARSCPPSTSTRTCRA